MSTTTIFLIAFACPFGSGLLGLLLHRMLPEHHLSRQSRDAVILLDHVMARYGSETQEIRNLLRLTVATRIEKIWGEGKEGKLSGLLEAEKTAGMEEVHDKLRRLSPQNDYQRLLHTQALQIAGDIVQSRWLIVEQARSSLSTPFLVILVFWLAIFFLCFGLFAESNGTVIGVMFVCCLSVCFAIFLVLEMSHPLQGMIKLSSAPLRAALDLIGK